MNEIDWETIDIQFKNIKQPLVFIYSLIKKKDLCSDDDMALLLRYYLKHHSNIALKYNLLVLQELLKDYPISMNILKDFYDIIREQLKLVDIFKKIRKVYTNKFFWEKDLKEQNKFLKNVYHKYLAIFDCSKGPLSFHLKLKVVDDMDTKITYIHTSEIIYRLRLAYKLFDYKFFHYNKILTVSIFDFNDMSFKNKIKYVEYIFLKINKILVNYLNYFQLYASLRMQLENLLTPSPVNFEIGIVQSEIGLDDINFILGIE